ncbi:hypothetical protein K737_301016 [Holospora undulata HU1]|uniref:Uncharacterized protein n=1 Tax=Holospora undulata HU1 TaxID=1321371 RepID=A0A061JHZ0_9PROT|nr:hypothetical protein K737_301016 [Holospora undulata HU1]
MMYIFIKSRYLIENFLLNSRNTSPLLYAMIKTSVNFLGVICLASMFLWLNLGHSLIFFYVFNLLIT